MKSQPKNLLKVFEKLSLRVKALCVRMSASTKSEVGIEQDAERFTEDSIKPGTPFVCDGVKFTLKSVSSDPLPKFHRLSDEERAVAPAYLVHSLEDESIFDYVAIVRWITEPEDGIDISQLPRIEVCCLPDGLNYWIVGPENLDPQPEMPVEILGENAGTQVAH